LPEGPLFRGAVCEKAWQVFPLMTTEHATTLWLMRHGLPEGAEGRCCGRYDVGLSAQGIAQAKQIAGRLANEQIARVYSSPLRRSLKTAEILAEQFGLRVDVLDGLAEMHFGDLEGLTYEEIERRYPDVFLSWMEHPLNVQFPNGESFAAMRRRVLVTFESLVTMNRGQTIAVVAHAGVSRLVIAETLSIPHAHMFRLAQDYGSLNRLKYLAGGGAVLELMNG
jgi:alpha-ribazole phosphatase